MAVEPFLKTRAQRLFIVSMVTQAIVVLIMVAITFRMVEEHVPFTTARYKTIPCYLALFALAEIFELIMAFDALRLRNIIQLIGILIFHAALIVMAALQVHQTRTAMVQQNDCDASVSFVKCDGPGTLFRKIEPFLIVTPCILGGSWLILLFWIKELYAEFGWAIFHVVGANPKMKTMYQFYQVMICLLKFDFFAFTGVTMQLLIVVLSRNSAEFGVTITAIPVVLVLLAACGVALQREIKWLMTLSLVLMLASMSYFLYKLVRFYDPFPMDENPYISTRATLTVFTLSAFLLLFATFAVGLRCFADFDRGLRASKTDDISSNAKYSSGLHSAGGKGDMSERQSSYVGGTQLAPRISIE
ncbi:hypothetical protein PILCRDRAFT_815514 [Piloderma croceum F 1598]|uniref:Uncharacterized protein n=1 Tax=Piloderma croceum (strain F 1598) TaxID=765440 RepID=A0A0C3BKT5_PILCF|nr:hypothetical protein PILCRDRAFT_815514 [Piloderma croceum F 1598]